MTDVLTRYETYRHHWQANVVLIFGETSDLVSSWEGIGNTNNCCCQEVEAESRSGPELGKI